MDMVTSGVMAVDLQPPAAVCHNTLFGMGQVQSRQEVSEFCYGRDYFRFPLLFSNSGSEVDKGARV